MRILKLENQENNMKKNELEKENEKQMKLNKERAEWIEKEIKERINSNNNLAEQINEMKKDAETRRKVEMVETTIRKREAKTLKGENHKLINSIDNMRTTIEEKDKVIAQIDKLNRRLHTHNNHLAELCLTREPTGKNRGVGNDEGGGKTK